MAGIYYSSSLWTILLLILVPMFAVNGSSDCEQECGDIKRACERFQVKALKAWKEISTGNQLCAPCTRLENQLKKERAARARQKQDLVTVMITALASEKQQATVPHPEVKGTKKGSVNLSCESGGQPLTLCVWEKWGWNGQRDVIIVDQEVAKKGGVTSVQGIRALTDELENGKCVLKIRRLKKEDFGSWSCTLVTKSGTAYGGEVRVLDENEPPSFYFASSRELKRYSLDTAVVETVANSSTFIFGVAFDWLRDKVYWSNDYKIFRSNRDGTEVETVLDNEEYDQLRGLALDWVSGNIYIASLEGFILACDGRPTASFACVQVLTDQFSLRGLALDPIAGTMYWTNNYRSSIMKSELDGRNPVTLVTGLRSPMGIAIDFPSQRLYWADWDANKIQSSDLQGRDVQTVFQVSDGLEAQPYGVAVVGKRIYWSTWGLHRLQSGNPNGFEITTHYNGTTPLWNLAVMPSIDLPRNRTNHCAGHNCRKVCVLTATSYRCLE